MKQSISEALYTYNALLKRKPFLDQLMDGLEEIQVGSAMRRYLGVFEPLFVSAYEFTPQDVMGILHPRLPMTQSESAVYNLLKRFITECNQEGIIMYVFVHLLGVWATCMLVTTS